MVLYLIGLGLGSEEDITLRGLKLVQKCVSVYLENYTSILSNVTVGQMEALYGRKVITTDRDSLENDSSANKLLKEAKEADVAVLVVGDPFGATTHSDLVLRARREGVVVSVVHNASIMTAVGVCGLQLYRFGQTVSVPFFESNWRPGSFIEKVIKNMEADLHTLVLLDIKVKEQTVENMMRQNEVYEPARFMTVKIGAEQILEKLAEIGGEGSASGLATNDGEGAAHEQILTEASLAFGLARVGSATEKIVSGTLLDLASELAERLVGAEPLQSLVICAPNLHEVEQSYFDYYDIRRRR